MNRSKRHRTALLASIMLLGTYGVGAQIPVRRDASVGQEAVEPLSSTDGVVHKGLLTIDVTVTDGAGSPVSDLAPWDFTLLDNGQPAKIRTFSSSLAPFGPAPELIFVIDTVNLTPQQFTETQSAITRFLLRNNGHLKFPCLLYRLTKDGLFSSLRASTDGALLVDELEGTRSLWEVWNEEPASVVSAWTPSQLSLRALGAIAIGQRNVPGHKVVVWIGPGWPANGRGISFDLETELSTRLREARITVDNINVWLDPIPPFDYRDYLNAPRSQTDMQPPQMALQVIATHTGGLVLDSSEDPDGDIDRCAQQVQSFYTLSFNPPHTDEMDEYHDLRVEVRDGEGRSALAVRSPTGYYNEPVYFDHARPGIEEVTVTQLEELVHSHSDLARRLANLELTERLSTPRLDALLKLIHGERERQALTADADLSIALAPPPDESVSRPPPPLDEQRAILRRTFDYLQNAIPKLPDFYASRDTVRFEEPAEREDESWKMPHQDQSLHFATGEHATVLYRNGREVVEKKKKLGKSSIARGVRAHNLETSGTFGPILAYVWTAASSSPGTLAWKRWERGQYGDLAVFSYRAASPNVGPDITYCCLPQGNGTTLYQNKADTFGEFAINPDTGAIMRIVTNADLDEEHDPDVPLVRSQIMVEYGPEELGGKSYMCPQRSVNISRGRSLRELHEWGMTFSLYGYFETMINDVSFGGYHKFGSEARILPGFEATDETNTPTPSKKPHR